MAFTVLFDTLYSDDASLVNSVVPPLWPGTVSIAGHTYLIDTSFEPYRRDAFRHRSIQAQRDALNFNNEPGEASINTEGLWRRGMDDWQLGSGQIYLDRKGSSPNRFLRSKGVNPWNPYELSLLNDTKNVFMLGPTATLIKAIAVGQWVYILTAGQVYYTQNWTTIFSLPVISVGGITTAYTDIATDGNDVWVASNNGVWATTAGSASMTQFVASGSYDSIGRANDFLLASSGAFLYIINSDGSTTQLMQHPNATWVWTNYAGGSSQIYIAGHSKTGGFSQNVSGGQSNIYRTTTDTDGTTLLPPVIALPLQLGEVASCLASYLNFVFVGTNLGVRMCQTLAAYDPSGNQGDLRAGPLIPNITQPVAQGVTGIVGSGRFVYFSWANYDTLSTGIGRMDLTTFIDALAPAYTSDLMVTGRGQMILDWDPITNGPLMALQGNPGIQQGGVWVQDVNNVVSSGTVDSGYVTFGIADDKISMLLDARTQSPMEGSLTGSVSVDQALGQQYTTVGATYSSSRNPWTINQIRGELFQIQIQLSRQSGTLGPTLSRWTLKAYPGITTGIEISAVLLLSRMTEDEGLMRAYDPYAEYAYLENLRQNQQLIQYVEGVFVRNVLITSLDWLPNLRQDGGNRTGFNADLIVYMKTLPN